jgi:surface protein
MKHVPSCGSLFIVIVQDYLYASINDSNIREAARCYKKNSFNMAYGYIKEWDTSEVTNMSGVFQHMPNFNKPIGDWNVKNVTNMSHMFHCASRFNQPLAAWEVDKVDRTKRFNQPLGKIRNDCFVI